MSIKHFLQFNDLSRAELEHIFVRTQIIKQRFKADYNRLTLPKEIYMAYTMGYQGAKDCEFKILNAPEYKQRAIIRFMEKYSFIK